MKRKWSICVPTLLIAITSVPLPAQDHSTDMELRHNMPFVQVMVNGKGPFTFSIDTGTGGEALVTPALIQQLNLPVGKSAKRFGVVTRRFVIKRQIWHLRPNLS